MSQLFNQIFFLRKSKGQNSSFSTVYLRITINGIRTEISTQKNCDQKKWSSSAGRLAGKSEDIKVFNTFLNTSEHRIYEIYRNLLSDGKEITGKVIRQIYFGISERPKMLVDVYQQHNKQVAEMVGKDFAIGTLKKFKTALLSLESFIQSKFDVSDLPVNKVNYQFITDYEFYLKTVQGLQHNTAMGILKKIKKIIRQCVTNEWLSKDPFTNYKI